ncbi:chemotaxis protein CheW [Kiloniella spongiae]|uniref:Chemotaxis protein CheW n=1 Tax=Kiloniella spongiae TaxID=1489064 RepID=A0A0H2MBN5_9PROT|nr:chemotaxis protein CheW [Kiloniella spongiae]KLN59929.1 chemotaxis protein CheW [Kiloniella spongiae]
MESNSLVAQENKAVAPISDAKPQNVNADGTGLALAESSGQEQYITFTVGEQEYGVDIMSVREIKGWVETTLLPNTPDYMRGVLNLRGVIVPIFDLRCRFGLGETEATNLHVIVIIAVKERMVGILVDTVSDILTVSNSDIRDVPKMETLIEEEYLSGLVTIEERMVALLNQEKLFDTQIIEKGISVGLTEET